MLLLLSAATTARAQAGTRAPIILELPAGVRTLGLGNTGVAGRDDDVIFYNPAQVAVANGFSVSGERFSTSAGSGALSAVTRFNGGGIAIGMQMLNYDLPNFFPASRLSILDGGLTPAMSAEAIIAFAQPIKGTRVGIAAKYAEDDMSSIRLGRALADVGVSRLWFGNTIGLAVQNIGEDLGRNAVPPDTHLPTRTTLGVSRGTQAGPLDLFGTAAVSMLRTDRVDASGGLEAAYSWLSGYSVALRAGVRRRDVGIEPLTLGAGLTMDRMTFDYAMETLSNQRLGHRFGIRVR
ncbi:MAG TPA: hypothetical protein VN706_18495 [Gemmatimonadaceae bacterium]|nr:hypothetical protein [Gemmatimonadaceae bacterium]